jgi:predicted SprT family Zn-dependent metalloprotease
MELIRAVELLEQELRKNGLVEKGWRGAFDSAKRRCGLCCYHSRTIYLSRPYVTLNDEALVLDTIRHEIAHALAGGFAGHGRVWQLQAIACGAKPQRCKSQDEVNVAKGKYTGTCQGCGITVERYKRLKDSELNVYHHNGCPKNLSDSRRIEWAKN